MRDLSRLLDSQKQQFGSLSSLCCIKRIVVGQRCMKRLPHCINILDATSNADIASATRQRRLRQLKLRAQLRQHALRLRHSRALLVALGCRLRERTPHVIVGVAVTAAVPVLLASGAHLGRIVALTAAPGRWRRLRIPAARPLLHTARLPRHGEERRRGGRGCDGGCGRRRGAARSRRAPGLQTRHDVVADRRGRRRAHGRHEEAVDRLEGEASVDEEVAALKGGGRRLRVVPRLGCLRDERETHRRPDLRHAAVVGRLHHVQEVHHASARPHQRSLPLQRRRPAAASGAAQRVAAAEAAVVVRRRRRRRRPARRRGGRGGRHLRLPE
eukprot:Rhum_TRINITY_DN14718_c0_g2::Rhum_TRINITY_DN14718_c0_g2_i1::g.110978::m.110978